jgi:hypothetical protein
LIVAYYLISDDQPDVEFGSYGNLNLPAFAVGHYLLDKPDLDDYMELTNSTPPLAFFLLIIMHDKPCLW